MRGAGAKHRGEPSIPDIESMRILYAVPHPIHREEYGGAFRSVGILRGLTQKYEVTLTFPDATTKPANFRKLLRLENIQVQPIQRSDSIKAQQRAFAELTAQVNPDLIWYSGKESVRLFPIPHGAPTILDFSDVPWHRILQTARVTRGGKQMQAYVRAMGSYLEDVWFLRQTTLAVIANAEEKSRIAPLKPVYVIPNGFDFSGVPAFPLRTSKRLLFLGSLFYEPNVDGIRWFCQEIFPLLRQQLPDVALDIVGSGGEKLKLEGAGITVHGFVKDIEPFIANAAGLVVPLRIGSGTRIKILEAWAKGLPVISTRRGAEGLETRDGETLRLADSTHDFVRACAELVHSPADAQRMAQNGFEYGRARFDWSTIYPHVQAVVSECARIASSRVNFGGGRDG